MAVTSRTVPDYEDGQELGGADLDQLPKGWEIICGNDSTTSGVAGTATTLCSCSSSDFDALTARRFEFTWSADVVSTVAGDLARVRMLIDGIDQGARFKSYGTVRSDDPVTIGRSWIINLSAGGHSAQLDLARQDGTGTLTSANSQFTIKDIGPF